MENFTKEGVSVKVVTWDSSGTFLPLVVHMKSNVMSSVIKMKPEFEGLCQIFIILRHSMDVVKAEPESYNEPFIAAQLTEMKEDILLPVPLNEVKCKTMVS